MAEGEMHLPAIGPTRAASGEQQGAGGEGKETVRGYSWAGPVCFASCPLVV